MSLVIVIKGPVARAGSMLNRSSVNGTKVPNIDANITTENTDNATEMGTDIDALWKITAYPNTTSAIISALINTTPNSVNICFPKSFNSCEPLARPCTIIADD